MPMDISVRAVATAENVEDHLKQLHTALRHCLGLLICYIEKDEHDHGKKTDLIGVSRSFVRVQMEQLIYDIKDLLAGPGSHLDTTPHPHEQCTSVKYKQYNPNWNSIHLPDIPLILTPSLYIFLF